MKRRALKLALFLLAGAIINVGVAWGLAILIDPSSSPDWDMVEADVDHFGDSKALLYRKMVAERFGTRMISIYRGSKSARPVASGTEVQRGWPAFALSIHRATGVDMRRIPTEPIFPGFAINTIFYAAIVWGLFAVPGAVRRLRGGVRRKRGQCAACGYSLWGRGTPQSDMCPECGAAASTEQRHRL